MARKKVNLAWIRNDAIRRTTLKKRRLGLIKKVNELSILCGVRACAIIYGPHDAHPVVWPSESEARDILQHFKGLPIVEQEKKMVDQEGFLEQRVKKLVEQFQKMEREIRENEISVLMYEGMVNGSIIQDVSIMDATSLYYFIDMMLKAIYETMEVANAQIVRGEVTTKELLHHNMFPAEVSALNNQMVYGPSNSGLMSEMMQPYVNNEGQWINPNLSNF